ncbi:RNA chaperone Hfq [Paenibacillus sp. MZ04-78.2]|uniref:RNA chaperone Hfq n=1 Tax=Paenibacillus sp. MZ04-78.2 TaxID=2962034 RepID=UPI0020B6EDB9|nr:RNA chaperone Hfq [Paenibacillus sp. MZ04-78.2]MCP3772023.1 RNA chaperone Hfq [Paenibacillus sp. MZ04-78.2]
MTKSSDNVQNKFLDQLIMERIPVTLITKNGVQMQGILKSTDRYTILIEVKGRDMLVNKVAVSTIVSSKRLPV